MNQELPWMDDDGIVRDGSGEILGLVTFPQVAGIATFKPNPNAILFAAVELEAIAKIMRNVEGRKLDGTRKSRPKNSI